MKAGITLIALVITIVVMLILVGISLSSLRGENGILAQTKSARIKTELGKFMEEGEFAYSELYAERVNNPEVVILESDIIAKLMSNYGYEGRITEIMDGVPTSITIGNITEDVVANGEKVVVGVQKGGENSTYYVEILGKYYPIHFNNLEISVKEEEGQEQAGRIDNTEFTATSGDDSIVIATAKNTNGVLTVELEGKSRGTTTIEVKYGTLESKIIQVNVKGKTRITVVAEVDGETGSAKGTITSPTELDKEYVDGEKITLTAEGINSNKLIGWYIGDEKLILDVNNQYTVPNNLVGDATIIGKFKKANLTDIYVTFESSTGTLRFYNRVRSGMKGTIYKKDNENLNLKNKSFSLYGTPWYSSVDDIKKVIFVDPISPISTKCWFYNCKNLTIIENIENLDTINVTSMNRMFNYCSSLTSLDLSGFDMLEVTDMGDMFNRCSNLISLDLSGNDMSKVTDMSSMFNYCTSLTDLDLSEINALNLKNTSAMFFQCEKLNNLNMSGFYAPNITTMSQMFADCYRLTNIDLSGFYTSNATNFYGLFVNCSDLISLDLSKFDTSNVTNMGGMFHGCCDLITIYASDSFDTSNVTSSSNMFKSCDKLVGGNGTKYNSSYVDKDYAKIDKSGQVGYFTDISKKPVE